MNLDALSVSVLALGVHHAIVAVHTDDDLATLGGKWVVGEGCDGVGVKIGG